MKTLYTNTTSEVNNLQKKFFIQNFLIYLFISLLGIEDTSKKLIETHHSNINLTIPIQLNPFQKFLHFTPKLPKVFRITNSLNFVQKSWHSFWAQKTHPKID